MEYDIGREEAVSTAVVRAVGEVQGDDPRDVRPLADVVDPVAMDALFEPRDEGSSRTGGRLTFVYNCCRVRVESGEYLTARALADRQVDG